MNMYEQMDININTDFGANHELIDKYNKHLEKLYDLTKFNYANIYDTHKISFVKIFDNGISELSDNDLLDSVVCDILGLYYCYVLSDYEMACDKWNQAVKLGSGVPMFNLGLYYYNVTGDEVRGIRWLKASSTHGFGGASFALGAHYAGTGTRTGNRVRPSDKILKYYKLAVKQGYHDAHYFLGIYYSRLNNYTCALEHYEKVLSVSTDVITRARTLNNLGCCYCGYKNDYGQGKRYYEMSAELGSGQASNNLGLCYRDVENDLEKAVFYFNQGVERGVVEAMWNLGYFYEIYKKDTWQAIKYYLMALGRGSTYYLNNLLKLVKSTKCFDVKCDLLKCVILNEYNGHLFSRVIGMFTVMDKWKILTKIEEEFGSDVGKTYIDYRKNLESERQFLSKQIKYLKNKLLRALKHQTLDTCPICLEENVLCVEMKCGHPICFKCYSPNLKCYYRC